MTHPHMNKSHSFFAQEPSVEPIGVIEAPGHEGKVLWIGGADGGAPCCGFRSKECRKPLDFEFVFHEFILVLIAILMVLNHFHHRNHGFI